jgi:predicted metal-dependent hydrolase
VFRRPLRDSELAFTDGAGVLVGGRLVRLRVDARARRISLRIDAARREVVATAPSVRSLRDAARFAETRQAWIEERLDALPAALRLAPGLDIEVAGAPCRLERAAMRIRPRYVEAAAGASARLIASGEGEAFARAALRGLKALALERLCAQTAVFAVRLGQPMPLVRIMDARMRWGSCRKAIGDEPGRIRYNWRLILAPPDVLDYVAAHEAAHLVEANHSAAYWNVVERIFGDPGPQRAWLRAHGGGLRAING